VIPALTSDALRRQKMAQFDVALKSGKPRAYNSVRLVFPAPDGTPWLSDAFSSAFYYGIRARGLPIVTVHGLRHTYATLGLRAGASIKVV
jgi:integrase